MKILRTAIIGAGRIGWEFHIPEIVKNNKYELIAVVDPLESRLKEADNTFSVKGFSSIEQLLQNEKPDLIVIASPTPFHKEQAILAMEAGCNVLCDKPLASNLEDVDLMIEAMKRYNRKLMVYQPLRFTSEFLALKSIVDSGIIGKTYMIKGAYSNYTRRNDWQAFLKNGGGMLNNYGAHLIDKMLVLANSKAERIECELRTIAALGDADDVVKAIITMENGVILDVDINMATAHEIRPWHIIGECGSIIPNSDETGWIVKYFNQKDLKEIPIDKTLAAADRKYSSEEKIPWHEKKVLSSDFTAINYYDEIYKYFELNNNPLVPVSETRELMRVLKKCRESNKK